MLPLCCWHVTGYMYMYTCACDRTSVCLGSGLGSMKNLEDYMQQEEGSRACTSGKRQRSCMQEDAYLVGLRLYLVVVIVEVANTRTSGSASDAGRHIYAAVAEEVERPSVRSFVP